MPKVVAQSELKSRANATSNGSSRSYSNIRRRDQYHQGRNKDPIRRPEDSNIRTDTLEEHSKTSNRNSESLRAQFGTRRPNTQFRQKGSIANDKKYSSIPSEHSKPSRRDQRFRASNNTKPYKFDRNTPPYGPRVDRDRSPNSSAISYRECEHNNKKRKRVETLAKKIPVGRDLPPWLKTGGALTGDNYEMLHQEIKHFVEYISPSPEEHEMRFMVYKCIEKVIRTLWPEAQVQLFGSYDTQLYLPTSDIDMVIFLPDLMSNKKTCLYMLAQALEQSRVATHIRVVAKARVPIIKFQEVVSRFHVDISFNVENGVRSVPIIKELIQKNSGVRPLVLLLKQFLMLRGLNEVYNGGLGSYSILLIVVNFLQLHPEISTGQLDPDRDLGRLLVDLFLLYGKKFNYKDDGICVDGEGSYFSKAEKGWTNIKDPRLLSIQDPQDPSNDVSKGSFEIMRVKQAFSSAYDSLTSLLSSQDRSKSLQRNESGRSNNEGNSSTESNLNRLSSILDIVITISPGATQNRFHVASEYRNCTLQNHLKLQTTKELQTELDEVLDKACVSSISIFDKLGPIPSQSELALRESEGFWDQSDNHYEVEGYESEFHNFYHSPQMPAPPYYHFNTFPHYAPNMNVMMPMGIPGANIRNNVRMDIGAGLNMGMGMNVSEFPPHGPYFNPMQSFGHGNSFGWPGDLGGTPPPWSRGSYFPRW